jgi:hypothetical protein
MNNELFPSSEGFVKERPTKLTDWQKADFCLKMAQEIIDGRWSTSPIEDIAADIAELFPFYNTLGFHLAKELDEYYKNGNYSFTTDFIQWLDCLSSEYDIILDGNVKKWVLAHNVTPKFVKGQRLKANESLCFDFGKDSVLFITGSTPDIAMYHISLNPNQKGGVLLAYELVEARCEPIGLDK